MGFLSLAPAAAQGNAHGLDLIAVVFWRERDAMHHSARSRCTMRVLARSAHPGRPCAFRGTCSAVVPEHTRNEMSGADTGVRTRGLDHGVVALCQLSYIRFLCELAASSRAGGSRQIVKEQSGMHGTPVCPCGTQ